MKKGCLIVVFLIVAFIVYTFYVFMTSVSDSEEASKNRWFDIQGKSGIVKMHLGMPKDSVILLLGAPDKVWSHSSGKDIIEDISYCINNDKYPDLIFTFENGELKEFFQH